MLQHIIELHSSNKYIYCYIVDINTEFVLVLQHIIELAMSDPQAKLYSQKDFVPT